MTPTRIILDESVIPRRYAHVLMQSLYLDTVDMSCIVRSGCNESSTSEEAPSAAGGASGVPSTSAAGLPAARPAPPTLFEEATELYQVNFLFTFQLRNFVKYFLYFLADWPFFRIGYSVARLRGRASGQFIVR